MPTYTLPTGHDPDADDLPTFERRPRRNARRSAFLHDGARSYGSGEAATGGEADRHA